MINDRFRSIIVIVLVIFVIAVNVFANVIPIGGVTTAEVSDMIPIYFVPQAYVFVIWFFIYLGLIVYAIYQYLPENYQNKEHNIIFPWFVTASLANIIWILLWHYQEITYSVFVMLALLFSLIMIYLKLEIGRKARPKIGKWTVAVPFSLYLGWISVATIANISAALYLSNWNSFGISGQIWAAGMIFVSTILAIIMLFDRKDYIFSLVIIWAITGIALNFRSESAIVWTVLSCLFLLLLVYLYFLSKKLNKNTKNVAKKIEEITKEE